MISAGIWMRSGTPTGNAGTAAPVRHPDENGKREIPSPTSAVKYVIVDCNDHQKLKAIQRRIQAQMNAGCVCREGAWSRSLFRAFYGLGKRRAVRWSGMRNAVPGGRVRSLRRRWTQTVSRCSCRRGRKSPGSRSMRNFPMRITGECLSWQTDTRCCGIWKGILWDRYLGRSSPARPMSRRFSVKWIRPHGVSRVLSEDLRGCSSARVKNVLGRR